MARRKVTKGREATTTEIGRTVNPVTGETAPEGQVWVRSALNGAWVAEQAGIPYTLSVASETYWST